MTQKRRIFALLSNQGTAMLETALCEKHCYPELFNNFEPSLLPDDWDGNPKLTDCTDNEALYCQHCGYPQKIYMIAWTGGYEEPGFKVTATLAEAEQQAEEWTKAADQEAEQDPHAYGDGIAIYEILLDTFEMTKIKG